MQDHAAALARARAASRRCRPRRRGCGSPPAAPSRAASSSWARERPPLVLARGVVAVVVEAGLADRPDPRVGRRRSISLEVGGAEALRLVRVAADDRHHLGRARAPRPGPPRSTRRSCPRSRSGVTPGRGAPARPAPPSAGSQESRWQWVSTTAAARSAGVASGLDPAGRAGRALRSGAPPGSAPKRASSSDASSLPQRSEQALRRVGMNGEQEHGDHAQSLGQRSRAPGRGARPARRPSRAATAARPARSG